MAKFEYSCSTYDRVTHFVAIINPAIIERISLRMLNRCQVNEWFQDGLDQISLPQKIFRRLHLAIAT